MKIDIINLTLKDDECIAFCGDIHADSCTPSSRIDDYPKTVLFKLNDLREKCIQNNVKALFLLGDVFNRIQVTNEMINLTGREFMRFKDDGIKVFTIFGNHDFSRNNLENIIKSPLSLLCDFGIITHINSKKRVVINKKTLITPLDYTESVIKAYDKAPYNILVAHMFYSNKHADKKANIESNDVKNLGYNAIVLGHDHILYPIINVDGTDIIRGGALTRGTSHNYNFDRKVGFYILRKPWEYNTSNWEFINIKIKPMKDIVSNTVINKKFELSDLSEMVSDLVDRIISDSGVQYDGILGRVKNDKNLPDDVRDLLLRYFSDVGIIV